MLRPYQTHLCVLREATAQIKYNFNYFNDDWFYLTGCTDMTDFSFLDEKRDPDDIEQPVMYAINIATGYFKYTVNRHTNTASDFYFWTEHPSYTAVKDVVKEMEKLIKTKKRIEWRVISGCRAEKFSDMFCKKHGGTKSVLHDYYRDRQGNYHDKLIYEIKGEGK